MTKRNIDPNLLKAVIASGTWQLVVGWIILAISLLALLSGALGPGGAVFAIANGLLFWGSIIRMFHVVEAKLVLLITSPLYQRGQESVRDSETPTDQSFTSAENDEGTNTSRWWGGVALVVAVVLIAIFSRLLSPPASPAKPMFDLSKQAPSPSSDE